MTLWSRHYPSCWPNWLQSKVKKILKIICFHVSLVTCTSLCQLDEPHVIGYCYDWHSLCIIRSRCVPSFINLLPFRHLINLRWNIHTHTLHTRCTHLHDGIHTYIHCTHRNTYVHIGFLQLLHLSERSKNFNSSFSYGFDTT